MDIKSKVWIDKKDSFNPNKWYIETIYEDEVELRSISGLIWVSKYKIIKKSTLRRHYKPLEGSYLLLSSSSGGLDIFY